MHVRNSQHTLAAGAVLAVCILLLAAAPARADEVPWLYEVAVPVEDQSSAARLDAAGRALAEVLTRVTGLSSVPRNETVRRALAAPDLYYNQFRFERAEDEDRAEDDGMRLRLQFAQRAVLDLVRDARLPIWRSSRPQVMVWAVVEEDGERRILDTDSDHAALAGLKARARQRGVPLRLPMMDLADQLAVPPAAVWGRLRNTLLPASERYGTATVLVGRLERQGEAQWSASWELWVDGDEASRELRSSTPARLGRAAADLAADELASRYAVLDRGVRRLELAVSAVDGPQDYAELLRYIGGLEFVEEVTVSSVDADRLGVSLLTPADPDQLLELFRLDRRLMLDRFDAAPGGAIELVWQGR